ncbi:hypothetical protein CYMTET_16113, partial [Cymbomonas tetramitiformis]
AALMAATAGIATEYLFKEEYSTSVHLQNIQLYSWGILTNGIALLLQEGERLATGTLFIGFDRKVGLILMTMAAQGLCVAGVVKHMSNVTKDACHEVAVE